MRLEKTPFLCSVLQRKISPIPNPISFAKASVCVQIFVNSASGSKLSLISVKATGLHILAATSGRNEVIS